MRRFRIIVDGTSYDVTVEEVDGPEGPAPAPPAAAPMGAARVPRDGMTSASAHAATGHPPPTPGSGSAAGRAAQPGDIVSPMAGTVTRVDVSVGQKVAAGQTVLVLEAMKMNTNVTAPASGTVRGVSVTTGTTVAEGQVLMTIA